MKKITCLLALPLLLLGFRAGAQSLAVAASSSFQCYSYYNPNPPVNFTVTSAPVGVTSYSWTFASYSSSCGVISASASPNGSVASFAYSCCDVYTITCDAYNGTTLIGSTATQFTAQCPPSLNVTTSSNTICAGGSVSMTAGSGAANYTWTSSSGTLSSTTTTVSTTPLFYTSSSIAITPTASGCYTVEASNPGGCAGMAVTCITIASTPTVTVTPAVSVVCPGSSSTLTASGASSYVWSDGSTTSSIVVTPSVSTCYTVTGSGSCPGSGSASAVTCVSVQPFAPVTAASSATAVCPGSSATLTASGASTYSWSNGATGSSIVITPTASGCYTVSGSSPGYCDGSAAVCITVNAPFSVGVTTSSTSICQFQQTLLNFSGASSYSITDGTTMTTVLGTSAYVSPLTNTTYTVIGTNGACGIYTIITISVAPSPTVTIPAGSLLLCSGSSTVLTAYGASSYVWSTGATTSTASILGTPSGTAVGNSYTVTGTNSNGCSDTAITWVFVDPNCTMVWPGDANADGIVDNTDVFEIGLAYNATGAARTPISNAYTAQYANIWGSSTVSTGKNLCNADCNGDGTINDDDTLAIFNNYLLTHPLRTAATASANPDIHVALSSNMFDNSWSSAEIMLADASNPISQLYGVAFDINFDPSLIQQNDIYISYPLSFLNAANHNVEFKKADFNNGVVHAASVRTDHTDVSGSGFIAILYFHLKPNLPAMTNFSMTVNNATKIDKAAVSTDLNGSTATNIVNNVTGIKQFSALQNSISCYPNPASDKLLLQSTSSSKVNYHICDIIGKEIAKGDFTTSKTVDLSSFEKGTYIIRFENGAESLYKKLIIEK